MDISISIRFFEGEAGAYKNSQRATPQQKRRRQTCTMVRAVKEWTTRMSLYE